MNGNILKFLIFISVTFGMAVTTRPIRWRPSADPGQKKDPGDRIKTQRD